MLRPRRHSVLPGFQLTMGYTVTYLGLLVLIPLAALVLNAVDMSWASFWQLVASPRAVASFRLSLIASLAAASINTVFGLLVAWVLTRYASPVMTFVDGLVDLPFALPTAVGGIALTTAYAATGWPGRVLAALGIDAAFTPLGIVIALTFISLPFVVRTVQPVLADMAVELEEAAAMLGASRWQAVTRVVLPTLLPALLTGFAQAFARALGEYGSVVFISGNMPYRTEIAPLLIMTRLEQFDYHGATAIAVTMLVGSLLLLLIINWLQWRLADRLA